MCDRWLDVIWLQESSKKVVTCGSVFFCLSQAVVLTLTNCLFLPSFLWSSQKESVNKLRSSLYPPRSLSSNLISNIESSPALCCSVTKDNKDLYLSHRVSNFCLPFVGLFNFAEGFWELIGLFDFVKKVCSIYFFHFYFLFSKFRFFKLHFDVLQCSSGSQGVSNNQVELRRHIRRTDTSAS